MGNDQSKKAANRGESKTITVPPTDTKKVDTITPGMFIKQQTGAFSDRYTGIKVLGKGGFGEVVLCKDKLTSQECAVKVISKACIKKNSSTSAITREIELLRKLDHPNIMKLYEFYEDSGYYYLVGEVYTGGELFDKIVRQKRLDIVDAARTIRQILSGVNYMHHNNIVHRDLKPENLLLENDSKDARIKIIDFGLSTHFNSTVKMKDKIGTAYYIAPEVLAGSYTEKCDIWSAGVILYILITGRPPFGGTTEADILARVSVGKYPTKPIFESIKSHREARCAESLIRHMLMSVPTTRYTAQQCLDHEFITKLCTAPEAMKELPKLEAAITNMILFQASQKLAKAALLYMGSRLTTQEERRELTQIFEKFDKNGDGQLDPKELMSGYKELLLLKGVDITKVDEDSIEFTINQLLDSVDFDRNGSLSYSEFITVCMDRKQLLSASRLRQAFSMFDVDKSNSISADELQNVLALSGLRSVSEIKCVDKDQDGEINREEFENMLNKLIENDKISDHIKHSVNSNTLLLTTS